VTIPEGWEGVVTHSFKRTRFIRAIQKANFHKNFLALNKMFLFMFDGKTTDLRMVKLFFW
jgi:hypothetical protein